MFEKPITFDRVIRSLSVIAVLVIIYLLLLRLKSVLLPFLVSWIVAYMLNPLVNFIQYKVRLRNRIVSIIVALALVVGVLSAMVAIVSPMVADEISKIKVLVKGYTESGNPLLPAEWHEKLNEVFQSIEWDQMLQSAQTQDLIKQAVPTVWNVFTGSLSFIAGLAVVFVCILYTIFILLDYDKMSNSWSSLIPSQYRSLAEGLMSDLEQGMNSYFRGQALIAFLVGILFSIGFLIIGLPMAIVMGLFIGVLNLVPYLQTVGIIPCVMLGILQSAQTGRSLWLVFTLIAVVFIVVQSIQDLVLTPRIMGNVTGLKPAIILLALSVWGSLLGMVGMIIALPLTTLMISYYKRYILHENEVAKAGDEEAQGNGAEAVAEDVKISGENEDSKK
ncbi:MAG: AI-2E family transporter [Paludibacteraceae bacterium]|nr:AI-2E family transporter [Paludibacteraceae bacterium]